MKLIIASNKVPNSDFSASISPISLIANPTTGTYISPYFTASAQNGSGSYTYNWFTEGNASQVEILGQGANRIQMRISQIQSVDSFSLKCIVTDTINPQSDEAFSLIELLTEPQQ